METSKHYQKLKWIFLGAVILLSGYITLYQHRDIEVRFSKYLDQLKNDAERVISQQKGENLFIFHNQQLIQWGRNDIPLPDTLRKASIGEHIFHLKKGFYYVNKVVKKEKEYCYISPLAYDFPVKNHYTYDFDPPGTNFKIAQFPQDGYTTIKAFGAEYFVTTSTQLPDYLLLFLFLFLFLFIFFLHTHTTPFWQWFVSVFLVGGIVFFLGKTSWENAFESLKPEFFAAGKWLPNIAVLWYILLGFLFTSLVIKKKCVVWVKGLQSILLLVAQFFLLKLFILNSSFSRDNTFLNLNSETVTLWATLLLFIFSWATVFLLVKEGLNRMHPSNWLKIFGTSFLLGGIIYLVYFNSITEKDAARAQNLAQVVLDEENLLTGLSLPDELEKISEDLPDDIQDTIAYLNKNFSPEITFNYEVIPVPEEGNNSRFVFNFLDKKYFLQRKYYPFGLGFPELLNNNTQRIESNVSMALYHAGRLTDSKGQYAYPFDLSHSFLAGLNQEESYHHILRKDGNRSVIVSLEQSTLQQQFSGYLFFVLLFVLAIVVYEQIFDTRHEKSLKKRLQVNFSLIAIASATLLTIIAVRTIISQFEKQNKKALTEKIHSVHIELSHKLQKDNYQSFKDINYLNSILKKFSAVFFTDISLFNLSGKLMATSRPELYNKGFMSEYMYPGVQKDLLLAGKSGVIYKEEIGRLEYLSAYQTFTNEQGEILAYVNLPYFARQNELEGELTVFSGAMLNILLLVLLVVLAFSLILAEQINRPLVQLGKRLQEISLTGVNQKISLNADKEIMRLVEAYNEKVAELQSMVQELSKQERESAWKEMARQVAHEIKNPLTPIKLQAQFLQMKLSRNSEEAVEESKAFLESLIAQVDVLSKVANEFSQFGVMQKALLSEVKPYDILQESFQIFAAPHAWEIRCDEACKSKTISGDKTMLNRIFNNIIKNAAQALDGRKDGKITCDLKIESEKWKVTIQDNGPGMPNEVAAHIFEPYFTTKTKGTGLGLAMAQNLVKQLNGKIWFETAPEKGTTFYLEFTINPQ